MYKIQLDCPSLNLGYSLLHLPRIEPRPPALIVSTLPQSHSTPSGPRSGYMTDFYRLGWCFNWWYCWC